MDGLCDQPPADQIAPTAGETTHDLRQPPAEPAASPPTTDGADARLHVAPDSSLARGLAAEPHRGAYHFSREGLSATAGDLTIVPSRIIGLRAGELLAMGPDLATLFAQATEPSATTEAAAAQPAPAEATPSEPAAAPQPAVGTEPAAGEPARAAPA